VLSDKLISQLLSESIPISLLILLSGLLSLPSYSTEVQGIREFEQGSHDAKLLQTNTGLLNSNFALAAEPEEEEIIGEQKREKPTTTPVYKIEAEDIRKESSDSLAETLRGLPGFAINDVGYGADIHTGTFYRGASINQSVFLLNGRSIGTNVNTYHGGTDLNSIPTGAIDKVELSSGTSATLYGSEAIGGVVSITTKKGDGPAKFLGAAQFGSYSTSNYRGNYSGSIGDVDYAFSYERFKADNDYRVPVGAANRDRTTGKLFNGDVTLDNYYGSLSFDLNARNNISLDVSTITSRRGLLYFGFPLQRDRLDHNNVNVGLSWKAMLGNGDDSKLSTTLSFNQDYFSTYGPSGTFSRTGKLDSRAIAARIEHDWQLNPASNLRWGLDLKNSFLTGEPLSTVPALSRFNGEVKRDRFEAALFALNSWQLGKNFTAEVGLRQNFTSEFGSYLNPSVGARWALSPNLALRGSWVSVHRNPGLDQLYIFDTVHNWQPNPDLEPETGSSWTAGIDAQLSRNVTAQLTYFGSRLSDRLAVRSGRWANIGLVNTNGIEAALRWKLSPQWSTFLNYTYTDAKIGTGAEKGLQLGLIPYSVGRLGIGYASNGWEVNLFASYFSGARRALFLNSGDSNRDFSPSWLNLDLGLRVPLNRALGLTVFLENLADRAYEKSNRIYQPGLTYRVGLQANF
jgi:vitamin B12 transporter